jgi:hypothetical protein
MHNAHVLDWIVALVSFVLGVIFSAKISRFLALVVSDVEKDYAKALEKIKSLYDADTKALEAKVKEIQALYDADVAKLKADLGDANNKVTVLTSVIATPIPATPPPTTAAPTRTRAQIAADLATTQATEAQLQADLAAATA